MPTYRPPVGLGEPMAGHVIGRVVASNRDGLAVGDIVEGDGGWQDYAIHGPPTARSINCPLAMTWWPACPCVGLPA